MKKLKEKYINYLVYGGLTKQEYEEIASEILEKDRGSLSMASICLILMFSALFLGSLFSEMMAPNRLAYGTVGVAFLVIFLLCRMMRKRGKRFVVPLWYVAFTLILAYAIILNTVIRNDISATTFCAIMLVAPLLIIDRPWRVFCYFSFVTVIFIFVDFHQKTYYLAYTDTVNALCCIFLGSAIHIRIISTKMREMMQRRYIEKERDTDKLSGCLTKAAFERKVEESLAVSDDYGVLLVMDLDHFKKINDNYGHVFGDLVISTMGECIRESIPKGALSGRFGGDEYQVWMPGKYTQKEIVVLLNEMLSRIHSIETPDDRAQIAASIGVAVCPQNGDKYPVLFENADAALYAAKNTGRGRFVFCPEVRIKGEI